MEKAVLNVKELNVTQGMNGSYSHKGDLAIDIGKACEYLKAPFTGVIKRIYESCNAVWLESVDKVKYADGTEDYMTLMALHDNSVTSLYVGKVIKQGEIFYQPGIKGKVTGPHIHMAVGKGKFTGNGWSKNSYGNWPINNQYDITKALFVHTGVKQTNPMYDWKETSTLIVDNITKNVERDESMEQVEVLVEQLRVRKEPNLKGDVLGYAKKAIYNVLEKKEADGYLWVKIAENQWIATSDKEGWTKLHSVTDYKKLHEESLEKIKILETEIKQLKTRIDNAVKDLTI